MQAQDEISWDRLPDEPEDWFDKFSKYARGLGHEFTVTKAFRLYATDFKHTTDIMAHWSQQAHQWKWKERAKAWAEFDRLQRDMKWVARREQIREKDFQVSSSLHGIAEKIIAKAPDFIKTSRQETIDSNGVKTIVIRQELRLDVAIKALEAASKIQRLSAELETNREVVENTGAVKAYVTVSPDDWDDDKADKPVQASAMADTRVA